jgi:hypothetical protein
VSRAKAKRPASAAAHVHELRDRIESERRKLQRAAAVLLALVYALDRGLENEQAGDVASVALDVIEQAIVALDRVNVGGAA